MEPEDSVTHWIALLQQGDGEAAQSIWNRYFPRLVRLARVKLRGTPQRLADEEDVAASVMESLFRAAQQGRFPNLSGRDDLWRLVVRMTARKVVDYKRRELRKRRGGGRVHGESAIAGEACSDDPMTLAEFAGDAPTPDFVLMMTEECQRLVGRLADPQLQALALAKLEGYTNAEIAEQLKCSERSIERRLRLIRKRWESEQPS